MYNHGVNEATGVTSVGFNVTDSHENVLADQRFIITVRGSIKFKNQFNSNVNENLILKPILKGDKLPPVIILNKGLKVNQAESVYLTKFELDVKDDDTLLHNLKFHIITQPKLGRLENIKEPGSPSLFV